MNKKPGKTVTWNIEHYNPERDPKVLAIRLAEVMQGEILKKKDAAVFTEEAAAWEKKATKDRKLLARVRARDRGEPVETESRMDPLLTYDASALEEELTVIESTIEKFKKDAEEYLEEAQVLHKQSAELQVRIAICR